MLHPLLGVIAVIGAVTIVVLTLASEFAVRSPLAEAGRATRDSNDFTDVLGRNAEVVHAMGMLGVLQTKWGRFHDHGVAWQAIASDRMAILQAIAKLVRMCLQIGMLGAGAWLALEHQVSAGSMIAASIITGRALAPVEMLIGQWRALVNARQAARRLRPSLRLMEEDKTERTRLPPPSGVLVAQQIGIRLDEDADPILTNVSFAIEQGHVLGIIGPSGAGKSTLVRLLVGLHEPNFGVVRLDGADISQWPREYLGSYIGYLPQDVELMAGTVAANISRFGTQDSSKIVEAAKFVGAHDMILKLPEGYETSIGDCGRMLSGGQRQRLALARAVYGDTRLIVLDEPNANLDAEGESFLLSTILRLKQRKQSVIIVTHQPSLLGIVDQLLVLRSGRVEFSGPRDGVLAEIRRKAAAANGAPAGWGRNGHSHATADKEREHVERS
jgi:PrtD family type I secretion system ABC transporter